MLILAFDTCSSGFSIALLKGENLIAQTVIIENGKQSELLVLEIENLLKSQNLSYQNIDLIAATNGPGNFTGTRIGIICAKTIRSAIAKNLIFVSTLEVAAFECEKIGKIFVTIDAGNDDLFIAEFLNENNQLIQTSQSQNISRNDLESHLPKDEFFLLEKKSSEISAEKIGLLALKKFHQQSDNEDQSALYLRDPKIGVRKK